MNPEVPSGTAGNFPRLGAGEDASGSQGLHRQSTRMNGANEIFSLDPGLLFSSMSGSQPQVPSKFALGLFFLTGAYSLAVPLVITPIALFRLSGAIHGHPIFGWVLCFYLSSLMPGAVSLITVCRTRWFIMLWLPLAGITLNGALGFLALCFWVLSGMNIQ